MRDLCSSNINWNNWNWNAQAMINYSFLFLYQALRPLRFNMSRPKMIKISKNAMGYACSSIIFANFAD